MHPAALDIALDGPYGRSFDYSEHETVVLVAGSCYLLSATSLSTLSHLNTIGSNHLTYNFYYI